MELRASMRADLQPATLLSHVLSHVTLTSVSTNRGTKQRVTFSEPIVSWGYVPSSLFQFDEGFHKWRKCSHHHCPPWLCKSATSSLARTPFWCMQRGNKVRDAAFRFIGPLQSGTGRRRPPLLWHATKDCMGHATCSLTQRWWRRYSYGSLAPSP